MRFFTSGIILIPVVGKVSAIIKPLQIYYESIHDIVRYYHDEKDIYIFEIETEHDDIYSSDCAYRLIKGVRLSEFIGASQHDWLALLECNGCLLRWMPEHSFEMAEMAIKHCVHAIRFVKGEFLSELSVAAVQSDVQALQFIESPSFEIVKYCLDRDIWAIRYLDDKYKTVQICEYAMKVSGGMVFNYIPKKRLE